MQKTSRGRRQAKALEKAAARLMASPNTITTSYQVTLACPEVVQRKVTYFLNVNLAVYRNTSYHTVLFCPFVGKACGRGHVQVIDTRLTDGWSKRDKGAVPLSEPPHCASGGSFVCSRQVTEGKVEGGSTGSTYDLLVRRHRKSAVKNKIAHV